jgi:hypothetical protein
MDGVALADSPASFVHSPLNAVPVVSAVWNWSAVQVVGLLTVSAPVVPTVTLLVYQPFEPGVPAVTATTAVGGVESNLNVVLETSGELVLPALSEQ